MAIVSLQDVSLSFGSPPLLDFANLQIEAGEWVGLLGRNGAGKTSLLRLIYGQINPDSGILARQQNLRMAFLPQEVPQGLTGKIYDIVSAGLEAEEDEPAPGPQEPWQRQLQVDQILSRMQLDSQGDFSLLSAGLKRRVLLARGLVRQPQLLLLDEPTNHLDIYAIQWLENFMARWGGTLLFVTHDRAFLQRLATRIVELDRGQLYDWRCDYQTFLKRKEAMLSSTQQQNEAFDKKLAQEEQWIRRGLEARRRRNEGRVRALKRLREIRKERREQPGKVRLQIQEERRSGRLVIEAENVSFSYPGQEIVRDFSTTIQRGDKVGIVGPNGSGKTTLLRILMDELAPQKGSVRLGTHLRIAYFDQLRAQLDETKSILDNVGQGRDVITVNGKDRTLISYLEDFLFPPHLIHAPITSLSGGERNRLLLARLFADPANLLVMDEPTNDLDLDTLELLEDVLLDYKGTLLLVSHDRAFLNNLATSLLVLDGSGQVREYVGGYDDWQRQSQAEAAAAQVDESSRKPLPVHAHTTNQAPRKPGYKQQRALEAQRQELEELPRRIEALEAEQRQLTAAMAQPAFYQQASDTITQAANRLKEIETDLALAFHRWEELERVLNAP